MAEKKKAIDQKEIKNTFSSLFKNVDDLITDLKLSSSEEILNGSITEAQKLLAKIIPYQTFYEKLKVAKLAFDEIEGDSENTKVLELDDFETLDQEGIDVELKENVEKKSSEMPQSSFRIPILKALIFLGGSSEEVEVIEFVKKDLKNKLTKEDFEIPQGEDKEKWLSNVYFETAQMMDEGLLSNEASKNKWEIAQKGIDYLGKYAK